MEKENEILFEGKKYISLKQAAKISGYAKDYIGQLCRGGKVDAKRFGRDWFVDYHSLISYKLGVHGGPNEEEKTETPKAPEIEAPLQTAKPDITSVTPVAESDTDSGRLVGDAKEAKHSYQEIKETFNAESSFIDRIKLFFNSAVLKIKSATNNPFSSVKARLSHRPTREYKKIFANALVVLFIILILFYNPAFVSAGLGELKFLLTNAYEQIAESLSFVAGTISDLVKSPVKIFNFSFHEPPPYSASDITTFPLKVSDFVESAHNGVISWLGKFKSIGTDLFLPGPKTGVAEPQTGEDIGESATSTSSESASVKLSEILTDNQLYQIKMAVVAELRDKGLVVEKIIEKPTIIQKATEKIISGISVEEFHLKTDELNQKISEAVQNLKNEIESRSQGNFNAIALTNKIDNITDSQVADNITVSNYLPLSGGTISGNLTITGTCTGCGGGGSGIPDWQKETNFGVLTLTPTTTIPIWAKDAIYASSTLTVDGLASFANATATQLTVTGNSYFGTIASGTWNGDIISAIYGGIGTSTYLAGDILYASSTNPNSLERLAIGTSGQVLKISGGLPVWGTDLSGGGSGAWATTTDNLAIYPADTNDVVIVGSGATTTNSSTFEVIGNSYLSGSVGIGTTSPYAKLSVVGEAVANYFSATSTSATSTFPLLSSTQSALGTIISGIWQGSSIGDGYIDDTITASNYLSLADWYSTTTSDIAEGSNLYWTNDRFDSRLSATTTLPNLTTLLGLTNASTSLLTISGESWLNGLANLTNASSSLFTALGESWFTGLANLTNATSSLFTATGQAWFNSSTTFNGVEYLWPSSDGTNGQVLTTNSAGGLSWSTISGGSGTPDWQKETNFGTLTLTPTTTIPIWAKDAIYASSTLTVQGLASFQNATATQLTVTGPAYFNSSTTFNGVEYLYPTADGTAGQVLTTNSAGGLSWSDVSGGISPSFRVHKGGTDQTITDLATFVKITWSTEEFDTNNDFDLANDKFQPTVAGKYLLSAAVSISSVADTKQVLAVIYKNGTVYAYGSRVNSGTAGFNTSVIDTVVDANGTTDYFEIYVWQNDSTSETVSGGTTATYFAGSRIDGGGLWTDGGDTSYLATDDRVGVGTSTASAKLTVWATSTTPTVFNVVDSASTTLFTVLDSGNVGIGTTSPFANFSVTGNIYASGNINTDGVFVSNNSTGSSTLAGALGIAKTTPFSRLHLRGPGSSTTPVSIHDVAGGSVFMENSTGGTTNSVVGVFANNASAPGLASGIGFGRENSANWGTDIRFYTHQTTVISIDGILERARINASGYMGVANLAAATGNQICYNTTTISGFNTFSTCSSLREYKDNIQNLNVGLSAISQLQPRAFDWKATGEHQYGFIAEEIFDIDPTLATYYQGKLNGVDFNAITAVLSQAMKEITSIVDMKNATTSFASIYIDPLGNIGIGTTTPTHKLQVAGEVAAQGFVNISTKDSKSDITFLNGADDDYILEKIKNTSAATYYYNDEGCFEFESSAISSSSTEKWIYSKDSGFGQAISCKKRLGLIAEDAPVEVLSADGKGVDLYKMSTFLWSGVKAQQNKIDELELKIQELEARITHLETESPSDRWSYVKGATSTDKLTLSDSLMSWTMDQFKQLGIVFEKGIAKITQLFTSEIIITKNSDGISTVGAASIFAGDVGTYVENPRLHSNSKIFITFTSPLQGRSWFVSEKTEGKFRVVLSQSADQDISFDYWILQTDEEAQTNILSEVDNVGQNSATASSSEASIIGIGVEATSTQATSTETTTVQVVSTQDVVISDSASSTDANITTADTQNSASVVNTSIDTSVATTTPGISDSSAPTDSATTTNMTPVISLSATSTDTATGELSL